MAIIYSYPETTQILLTDMLIGTSTIRVAGKKKNLTKNFTIETLGGFIHDNFPTQWGEITGTLSNQTDLQAALDSKQSNITLTTIGTSGPSTFIDSILNIPNYLADMPTKTSDLINDGEDGIHPFITAEDIPPSASTLNDVLTNGNTSLLDAKIGELYLYDTSELQYGKIQLSDSEYNLYNSSGSIISTLSNVGAIFRTNAYYGFLNIPGTITANRTYEFPNVSGTIALTSDIPGNQNLQSVTDEGNTTTNQIIVESGQYKSSLGIADVRTENTTTGTSIYLSTDDGVVISNASSSGRIKADNIALGNNPDFQLPNKSGTFTIATIDDIPSSNSYGLFAQTANGGPVTATTVETTVIGTGVGTLTVPANGFKIGDSFTCALDGIISCVGTATLHVRVKTLTGVILADTGIIAMDTTTSKSWLLNLYFTIRNIGAATVASISSGGLFSYIKNSGTNFEGYVLSTVNNTTFDTTINNTLVITVQWNTNNAGNSILSRNFTLTKIY